MENITLCRVCLVVNVKMYWVSNTPLQDIFEKLTNIKLQEDGRPETVCFICYSLLRRCLKFLQTSLEADKILTHWFQCGLNQDALPLLSQPLNSLALTTIEYISLTEPTDLYNTTEPEIVVKDEKTEYTEVPIIVAEIPKTIKLESDTEETKVSDYISPTTDSEDEVPLKRLKKPLKRKIIKPKKKSKDEQQATIDAKEVLISKEQQIKDMLDRKKSLNYLESAFKCEYCFKGFQNSVTYKNHMEKHDKKNGSYECDICSMRYSSGRRLRCHEAAAHQRYYKCNKCGLMSHTFSQAKDHDKWHNGHTYACKMCSKNFKKRTSLLTHTRLSHPSEHVCEMCGYSFIGNQGLLLHKQKAHKILDYNSEMVESTKCFCIECKIQFVCIEALHRHLLCSAKHKQDNDYSTICRLCKENLPDRASFSIHLREHKKTLLPKKQKYVPKSITSQEILCNECEITFASKYSLQQHVRRVHLGLKYDKNIVCEVCGLKCTSNATLKYHQRRHTGERPYSCNTCTKKFSEKHQLQVHTRTHTDERPYSCHHCTKTFKQKPALNRHMRVHTGAKPYTCHVCNKQFSQSNSMKVHVNTVHLKMPAKKRNRDRAKTAT